MNKKKFNFELKDTKTPEEVVKDCVSKIAEYTKNMVICEIAPYEGRTESYIKQSGFFSATKAFAEAREVTVNIQNDLGEQSGIDNKFEVYFTVKGLEHYKYRIMFMRYGAISYPVSVVLNEDIAEAYSGKSQYKYEVGSMDELNTMLEHIFDTEYCTNLIQSLIYEAMRQESKDK